MIMRTLAVLSIAIASSANAAEYSKEVRLSSVGAHGTRPLHPSSQDKDFIGLAAGSVWSAGGGATCSEVSAVLSATNPTMRAVALAAIASGATVWVTVDSSLPMVFGACQVTTIYFQASQ